MSEVASPLHPAITMAMGKVARSYSRLRATAREGKVVLQCLQFTGAVPSACSRSGPSCPVEFCPMISATGSD